LREEGERRKNLGALRAAEEREKKGRREREG